MSYTPNFLVNISELEKAIEEDEFFAWNKEKPNTAEAILDEVMPFEAIYGDLVTIRGVEYGYITTEVSSQGRELSELFDNYQVEYYKFGG